MEAIQLLLARKGVEEQALVQDPDCTCSGSCDCCDCADCSCDCVN